MFFNTKFKTEFKTTIITVLLFLGLAVFCGVRAVGAPQSSAAPANAAQENWRKEFNDVCGKTQDAMSFYAGGTQPILFEGVTIYVLRLKRLESSTKPGKRCTWDDYECAEAFMSTCSMKKRKRKNKGGLLLLRLAWGVLVLLLGNIVSAQIYLPKPAPPPSEYGKVILDNSKTGPGPVVFDHWLHRSMYTCRLCHVDVGFAMQAKATGITARTNREGFHCGACHDGKKLFEGKTIFPACSDTPNGNNNDQQCNRCHSVGKKGVRKYEYKKFTAKFPKGVYGVNWEAAEKSGVIKPSRFC